MLGFLLFLFLVLVVCVWLGFICGFWGVIWFCLGEEMCVFVEEGELGLEEVLGLINFIVEVFWCIIEVIWFFIRVVVFLLSILFMLFCMVVVGGVELCWVLVLVLFVFRL